MKRLLPFLLLIFPLQNLVAQSRDSVRTEYSEENPDSTRQKMREAFRYITRTSVEEKTLIKAGLSIPLPFAAGGPGIFYGYGIEAGLEQKLSPSFSVQALLIGRHYRGKLRKETVLEMPISLRYYYSIKKRMRRGVSANNFSNNYVGLQTENILHGYGRYYGSSSISNFKPLETRSSIKTFEMFNALSIQWGMQRRLGRHSYVDMNFTFPIFPVVNRLRVPSFNVNVPYGINLKLGLGW